MTCSELQEKAAGLAALPAGDAERADAYRHAGACAACAGALREAEQVLALIDAVPPAPAPSDAALERAAEAIRAELRAEKAFWPRVARLCRWLLALVAAASVALAVQDAAAGGLEIGEGVECLGIELGSAALAVLLLGGLAGPRAGAGAGARKAGATTWVTMTASAAGLGAIAGQVVLLWRCPAHAPSHLAVFHVGGVLFALALGALAGRLLARPPEPAVTRPRS